MTTENDMKKVFNELFSFLKGKEKTPLIIKKCFSEIMNLYPSDNLIKDINQYFYPSPLSQEQNNEKKFWFQKYENPQFYTELNYALDILTILKNYLANKDQKNAIKKIDKLKDNFKSYKNVNYYLYLTAAKNINYLKHLTAFFQKDSQYFQESYNIEINPNLDLTNSEYLEDLFCGITISERELQTYKEMNQMKQNMKELLDYKAWSETKIQEMDTKLEKIYIRDTLKYSIKYIYRLFYNKYLNNQEFKSNIYDEICSIKQILKKPEFIKYEYMIEFLDSVEFGDLAKLNKVAHPPLKDRNFDNIRLYVDNQKTYLNKVIYFLKSLPGINEYINLEIDFYANKDLLEEKINENFNFNTIYDEVIGI